MPFDMQNAMDLVSALAILTLLPTSYGWLRRSNMADWQVQIVLGLFFGLVSVLQMNLTFAMPTGIVIDLRIVPVILASAFLGWRGAILCVVPAIAMRYSLGGVGASAGIAVVLQTAALGLLWARFVSERAAATPRAFVILGVLTTTSAATAILLPPDIAVWFLWNVTPILTVLYLVLVPVFATLMHREDVALWTERQLRASASTHPVSGLLYWDALSRAAANLASDTEESRGTGLILLQIRHAKWITRVHGEAALDTVRGVLRARLEDRLPRRDILGLTPGGAIAVLSPDLTDDDLKRLTARLSHDLGTRPVRLDDGGELRISLDMGRTWERQSRPLSEMMTKATNSLDRNARFGGIDAAALRKRRGLRDTLFDQADQLQA
ncbi:LytS/YhcK type 5TM receptor domain-containing protein [Jannaschia sp. LMIT008]|uniref:LytS/YhcK type 5TM receptor domain-containing protein n=1 Tax=Jannaschia maritima TaxID=3032585 RepID=UPI0028126B9E|nr:LytS/YhcK type 5TM receptor domain-containing protein [Jannaschia sp. LMIT008]